MTRYATDLLLFLLLGVLIGVLIRQRESSTSPDRNQQTMEWRRPMATPTKRAGNQ